MIAVRMMASSDISTSRQCLSSQSWWRSRRLDGVLLYCGIMDFLWLMVLSFHTPALSPNVCHCNKNLASKWQTSYSPRYMKTLLSVALLSATLALSASAQTLGDNYPLPSTGTLRLRQATGTGGAGGTGNTNVATVPADIQTAITDLLNGLPISTNLQTSSYGVATGAGLRNAGLENFVDFNLNLHTNYVFLAGIENAPGGSVVDRGTFRVGYRAAWQNAEIGVDAGVVVNWKADSIATKTGPQAALGVFGTTRLVTGVYSYGKIDLLLDESQPIKRSPSLLFVSA